MSDHRYDDAILEATIVDLVLRESGVVEADEPTAASHFLYRERVERLAHGEFTRAERREIRLQLGMYPFMEDTMAGGTNPQ